MSEVQETNPEINLVFHPEHGCTYFQLIQLLADFGYFDPTKNAPGFISTSEIATLFDELNIDVVLEGVPIEPSGLILDEDDISTEQE